MNCSICGSDRMLEGPAYSPNESRCCDCGSVFGVETRIVPEPEEISVAIREEVPFPVGGFSSPEEAALHLAKLKEAAKRLGKPVVTTEDKPTRKAKVHKTSQYPSELVFMEIHCFMRKGETWQAVLNTAKGERDLRNENVLIYAHAHISDSQCVASCKEIVPDGM